jgi:hypothetical protein
MRFSSARCCCTNSQPATSAGAAGRRPGIQSAWRQPPGARACRADTCAGTCAGGRPSRPFTAVGEHAHADSGAGDRNFNEYSAVHLCHEGAPQGGAPEPRDPEGNLAVLLPRRQDRRRRRQRLGQEFAAQDHGRGRPGLPGRGLGGEGDAHRIPAAGAGAGPGPGRARQRRGGGEGHARPAATVRRGEHEVRRGHVATRDAVAHRRAGRSRTASTPRRVGAGPQDRDRHGRAAAAAGGRRRRAPVRRRARRVALCKVLLEEPDMLLLDEPTNHLDAESVAWLERYLAEFPGTVVAITHDRYFLDNVAGGSWSSTAARASRGKGNYSSWLEQKQNRLAQEEKQESSRQRTLSASWSGSAWRPGAAGQGQGAHHAYEDLLPRTAREKLTRAGDRDPARPAAGRGSGRGGQRGQGLRRRGAVRRPELHSCRAAASSASSVRTAPARPRCSG